MKQENTLMINTKFVCWLLIGVFCSMLSGCLEEEPGKNNDERIKIGVSAFDDEAYYISDILLAVENLARDNSNVELVIRKTSKDNLQANQENINQLVKAGVDALIVNALEASDPNSDSLLKTAIDAAERAQIPVVFYGYRPDLQLLDTYDKAFFADSEHPARSAIAQAQMIMEHWKKHAQWDKNNDGIIQYVLLKGSNGNFFADNRTYWLESTFDAVQGSAIAENVASDRANWSPVMSEIVTEQWLINPEFGDKIEMVIANNDSMALGALKAIKKLNRPMPVYGIDGSEEALEKIQAGELTGSVENSPYYLGEMTYDHLLNLLYKDRKVEDGNYVVRGSSLFSTQLNEPIDKGNVKQYLK